MEDCNIPYVVMQIISLSIWGAEGSAGVWELSSSEADQRKWWGMASSSG